MTAAVGVAARGVPSWVQRAMLPLATFIGIVALQEIVSRTGILPTDFFPPASLIAGELLDEFASGDIFAALIDTVRTWVIALGISVGAGVVAGLVIGSSKILQALLRPVIDFLRPIPSVALIPLVVLIVGTNFRSGVVLAVFAAFWQVLIPVLDGTKAVDPVARDTARSYAYSWFQVVRWIQLPSVVPYVTTAMRLAASTTLILTVTAEIIIGIPGLGQEIALARSAGDYEKMYAYIVVTGLAGVALNIVMRFLEGRLTRSFPTTRQEGS